MQNLKRKVLFIFLLAAIALMCFYVIFPNNSYLSKANHQFHRVERNHALYSLIDYKNDHSSSEINFQKNLNNSLYPITIVSGYFHFDKSKHSIREYEKWMANFLPQIVTAMIIFTDKKSEKIISSLRNGYPTHIVVYESVWDLPPVSGLKENYFNVQHALDPEKRIHNANLYGVWNSKPWMLHRATELNIFNSTYFYWVDMGVFRGPQKFTRSKWPDLNQANKVFNYGTVNRLHMFLYDKMYQLKNYTYAEASKVFGFVLGGFFGGLPPIIKWWTYTYYKTHDEMMANGYFVGKEQNLMNFILMNYKTSFLVTYPRDDFENYSTEGCKNYWFYFQSWYASDKERLKNCAVKRVYKMEEFFKAVAEQHEKG